jgi:hypothetical protein
MKQREKDPFDYQLRSHKEIAFEQTMNPPTYSIKIIRNNYRAITDMSALNVHQADKRNEEVTIECDIDTMYLTPLQKKRMIFLLGPRWKNDGKVKIVSRQYPVFEHNMARGFDIFRQLYWEAKRAPMYIWAKMKNSERRAAVRKIFGKGIPAEQLAALKAEADQKINKAQLEFDNVYDNGNYTPKFIKENLQKYLDSINPDLSAQQREEETARLNEASRKAEEALARDNIEKNLVKKRILTKKAYDTFFAQAEDDTDTQAQVDKNTQNTQN